MKRTRNTEASDHDAFEVRVHFHGRPRSRWLEGFAAERLRRSLAGFATRLRRAAVRFRDINGNRGGVDQQCSLVLHMASGPPLYFDAVDASAKTALSNLARRASNSIGRLARKASRRRHRSQRKARMLPELAGARNTEP